LAAAAVDPSAPTLWQTVHLPMSTSAVGELPLMRIMAPLPASGESYVL
jgi:hypothetical protein